MKRHAAPKLKLSVWLLNIRCGWNRNNGASRKKRSPAVARNRNDSESMRKPVIVRKKKNAARSLIRKSNESNGNSLKCVPLKTPVACRLTEKWAPRRQRTKPRWQSCVRPKRSRRTVGPSKSVFTSRVMGENEHRKTNYGVGPR